MVNPVVRGWKKHLSEWAQCQKVLGGIYFTKKWRAETLQPGLEFDNFKPRLKSGIFKCIFWLNVFLYWVMIGVFWKRESSPIWYQCRRFISSTIFAVFTSIYSLRVPMTTFFRNLGFLYAINCRRRKNRIRYLTARNFVPLHLANLKTTPGPRALRSSRALDTAWSLEGFMHPRLHQTGPNPTRLQQQQTPVRTWEPRITHEYQQGHADQMKARRNETWKDTTYVEK